MRRAMKNPPKILVIGAGLIGLSVADCLHARGAEVTITDSRAGPGLGASFCNSGMIHPSQATPWICEDTATVTPDILDLARASKPLLLERARNLGLAFDQRSKGAIQLFNDPNVGKAAMVRFLNLGVPCVEVTDETYTFGHYALNFPEDASGNAHNYSEALARDIEHRGVRFIYNTSPTQLETLSRSADHTIIAAGTGSAYVGRLFGIDIPVTSAKGHALNFELPDVDLPPVPIMHSESRSALTVFRDHVRLSGTVGMDKPSGLLPIWQDIAPELMAELGTPVSEWSGERPMSRLGHPIIGPLARSGIWINTGHGHMGWTLCAGSGELMAQMILDDHQDQRFKLSQY